MPTTNYAPDGYTGGSPGLPSQTSAFRDDLGRIADLVESRKGTWDAINPESVARMRLQNRFLTGLDIARYTAGIMRADMAAYDADPTLYTQSLGAWHGFIAQQQIIAIKKHFGTTKRRYIYLSGWMVAALRSEFGPLPDQSMHEKTSVPALIAEIYTFLRQADAREISNLLRPPTPPAMPATTTDRPNCRHRPRTTKPMSCRSSPTSMPGSATRRRHTCSQEDDRGRRLCAADRKPGVRREAMRPPGRQGDRAARGLRAEDRAIRHAFLELGVDDGIIVCRSDSLGAGLTKQIAVSHAPGDLGDQYNAFLDCEEVTAETARNGDVLINRDGKMLRSKRLPSNLYQFRPGTGVDRCVLDGITSIQSGADLLWIETEKPNVEQIGSMIDRSVRSSRTRSWFTIIRRHSIGR